MKFPLVETFFSWQGEGCHSGTSAFFVRLYGCPVKCPWCDTKDSWHPDHKPAHIPLLSGEEIAALAAAAPARIIVVTGGEPCIHDLAELTRALRATGRPLHLETSGVFPILGDFAWVTVSPKSHLPLPAEALRRANELKIVVGAAGPLRERLPALREYAAVKPVWLVPEWSRREEREILQVIHDIVTTEPGDFRAGLQTHKYYGAA
jgi:organic radical activating enzyme